MQALKSTLPYAKEAFRRLRPLTLSDHVVFAFYYNLVACVSALSPAGLVVWEETAWKSVHLGAAIGAAAIGLLGDSKGRAFALRLVCLVGLIAALLLLVAPVGSGVIAVPLFFLGECINSRNLAYFRHNSHFVIVSCAGISVGGALVLATIIQIETGKKTDNIKSMLRTMSIWNKLTQIYAFFFRCVIAARALRTAQSLCWKVPAMILPPMVSYTTSFGGAGIRCEN
jgi:hypothetical protein